MGARVIDAPGKLYTAGRKMEEVVSKAKKQLNLASVLINEETTSYYFGEKVVLHIEPRPCPVKPAAAHGKRLT